MAGKFEIYVDSVSEYRFRLKAGNGEVILTSEGYSSKSACKNGVDSVKLNAPNDRQYDRKETSAGKFRFNLKAANHQIIGTSQAYASAASRDKGIESVKRNAADAAIVELS